MKWKGVLFVFGILIGLSEERRQINDLMMSKEEPNPLYFWQLRSSKHDLSYLSQHSYAVLYNVNAPQLSSITAGTEVLDFTPTSNQYVKISSIQDYAAAGFVNAMTIAVNIYFTSETQNTPLIQLFDAAGQLTMNIRLTGIVLSVDYVDSNGIWYNGEVTKLKPEEWFLVGFAFNMKWIKDDQADLFIVNDRGSTTATEIGMGTEIITLPAFESIVIGGDGSTNFQGEMNCVQFYNIAIIGPTRDGSVELCDQQTETPDNGDFSIDSFNLPILTTEGATTTEEITTEEITTEASTIAETTSKTITTEAASTVVETTETANTVVETRTEAKTTEAANIVAETTSEAITTKAANTVAETTEAANTVVETRTEAKTTEAANIVAETTSEAITTKAANTVAETTEAATTVAETTSFIPHRGHTPVTESCSYLRKQGNDVSLLYPLETITVTSLERCVSACMRDVRCSVVSTTTNLNGEITCRISDISDTTFMLNSVVYLVE
ncbi:mucin-22-like [Mytilus edulis]|uniref:mucin-22-like n=1 Tax=Mytilus edulis TaxID=6550 RepID=UPI0039EF7C9F